MEIIKAYSVPHGHAIGSLSSISLFLFELRNEKEQIIGYIKGEDLEKAVENLGFKIVEKKQTH